MELQKGILLTSVEMAEVDDNVILSDEEVFTFKKGSEVLVLYRFEDKETDSGEAYVIFDPSINESAAFCSSLVKLI